MKAIAELKHLLNEQFGPAILADDAEVLAAHRGDMTENPPGQPQLVVFPDSSEQVRAVAAAAGRLRIPLTAVVANTNLGGLANPVKGGVVVNLQRMNRILEINEADQYAVIEPGVTWQQLHDKLAAEYPGLRFAYPLSPPDTGIVPNCLMDGLANLSLRVGAAASWINALEVVLPSGELRTVDPGRDPELFHAVIGGFGQLGIIVRARLAMKRVASGLLEVEAVSAPGAEGLDGRSLIQLVRGETENWREYIDMEHDVCYSPKNHWNAMTDGHFKYIFHAQDGEEQLFDLDNDPGELTDLAPDPRYQKELHRWRERLINHLAERGEKWVKGGKLALRPDRCLYSPNYPEGSGSSQNKG